MGKILSLFRRRIHPIDGNIRPVVRSASANFEEGGSTAIIDDKRGMQRNGKSKSMSNSLFFEMGEYHKYRKNSKKICINWRSAVSPLPEPFVLADSARSTSISSLDSLGRLRKLRRVSLTDIPVDCLLEITLFFRRPREVNSFLRTCREFYFIATGGNYSFENVVFVYPLWKKLMRPLQAEWKRRAHYRRFHYIPTEDKFHEIEGIDGITYGITYAQRTEDGYIPQVKANYVKRVFLDVVHESMSKEFIRKVLSDLKLFPHLKILAVKDPISIRASSGWYYVSYEEEIDNILLSLDLSARKIEMAKQEMNKYFKYLSKRRRYAFKEVWFNYILPPTIESFQSLVNVERISFTFSEFFKAKDVPYKGFAFMKNLKKLTLDTPTLQHIYWYELFKYAPRLQRVEFIHLRRKSLRFKDDVLEFVNGEFTTRNEVVVQVVTTNHYPYQNIKKMFAQYLVLETNVCLCGKWSSIHDLVYPKACEISIQGEIRCMRCGFCQECKKRLVGAGDKTTVDCSICGKELDRCNSCCETFESEWCNKKRITNFKEKDGDCRLFSLDSDDNLTEIEDLRICLSCATKKKQRKIVEKSWWSSNEDLQEAILAFSV